MNMKNIGCLCAEHRRHIKITQLQVAHELGYSVENISAFENGRNDNGRILMWYIEHGLVVDNTGGIIQ